MSKKYLNDLNDLLSFADDNNVMTDNMMILKRAIEGLSLEIEKIGIRLNPLKSCIITYNVHLDNEETSTYPVVTLKGRDGVKGPKYYHLM